MVTRFKNATTSTGRQATIISDAAKGKITGGNYGYLDGAVNGNAVDNKMWRSVSSDIAENEIHLFDAISVQGSSGNEWLRITDSEYRMLNKLASVKIA